MKDLNKFGVRELECSELYEINGGIALGDAITLLNGILNIVLGYMNAAVKAVEDYINSFLEGITA
ncbi:hypothetical protein ED312_08195 [Sinomicrobium pectinilyticum]|uniref:Bacteriocin n=1 Tax=Sinomicrobium pectinilyticum TaxID=1084421 RepID=A0A3N0ELW1_SINP1|nr:hypothetical protein [Sinomicrobium pectinilyticum]RNL88752.1 hypothetical protein ED312_08195 [Sinomicrobium pectinilyticum]